MTEEKREASIKKINDKIAEGNGVVTSVDKWGMKKFAYPINFKNEGFYVLVAFEADAPVLTEIERRMKVSETFVRFMITSVIENRKTEAAKTAKKPERRERTDYGYNRDNRAPRAAAEEVVTA
ncbi:MAG: 30S ribosomal protein S6, partial [Clostridia bacterium]